MTTETPTTPAGRRPASGAPGLAVVAGCAAGTGVAVVVLLALSALVGGTGAALAALAGGLVVLGVFVFGTVSLHLVAEVLPGATLLVALVTYVAQGAAVLVAMLALAGTETFAPDARRAWLAGGVVLATVAWTAAQVVLTARRRIPLYDLPDEPAARASAARPTGGE